MKNEGTRNKQAVKKLSASVPNKKSKLSSREMKFAKGIVNGLSATEAMRQAGYAETTALVKQGKKLEKVSVYIAELMEIRGLTDDKLLNVLKDGLRATKRIPYVNIRSSGNPDGQSTVREITKDFIEVKDFAVRHKYLEIGLKLRGHLQKQDINPGATDSEPLKVIVSFVKATLNRKVIDEDGADQ